MSNKNVIKAEGDPVTERLVDLRVEEVSLVDAAANEERWVIVKRKPADAETQEDEMKTEENVQVEEVAAEDQVVQKSEDETQAEEAQVEKSEEATEVEATEEASEEVAETSEEATEETTEEQAEETEEKQAEEPVQKSDDRLDEVLKALATVSERLETVEKQLGEQAQKVEKAVTVRAVAKGDSVPSGTEKVEKSEENKSLWAGTSVHKMVSNRKK